MEVKITAQFEDTQGQTTGPPLTVPIDCNPEQLDMVLRQLLKTSIQNGERQKYIKDILNANHSFSEQDSSNLEEISPEDLLEDLESKKFAYYINNKEIIHSIKEDFVRENDPPVSQLQKSTHNEDQGNWKEILIKIVYQPQALFKVYPVTRCTSSLTGHEEAVLSVSFSPDGKKLASGSGDKTVRFWDLSTETPIHTGRVHTSWVLCIAWSPDGVYLASGSMDHQIQIWKGSNGTPIGKPLINHRQWITSLAWEPLHCVTEGRNHPYLVSGSKDTTAKIWDPLSGRCLFTLSQHKDTISCVKWSGQGYIYTGSRDRTICVWKASTGSLIHSLKGHAHWINTMALHSDYTLRTGPFDPAQLLQNETYSSSKNSNDERNDSTCSMVEKELTFEEKRILAKKLYSKFMSNQPIDKQERLVTGSDDFTLILWINPFDARHCQNNSTFSKSNTIRMNGHQGLVNHVLFSPDGQKIASGSFDKSIKIWHGITGQFLYQLKSPSVLGPIYQIAWSSDSRLIISGNKDSTLQCWDVQKQKIKINLPGHLDEVYSVDWSPDGQRVASGSKDKTLKLWRR